MLALHDLLSNTYALTGLCLAFSWILLSYYYGETRKLRHVPSVGATLPGLSLIDALRYLADTRPLVNMVFRRCVSSIMALSLVDFIAFQWPKTMFKIPGLLQVVVADPKLVEEVRQAPENIISRKVAIDELIQVKYTFGANVSENPYHTPIIRTQLRRALARLVPGLHDEIMTVFEDLIPTSDDWQAVPPLDTATKIICRASNRIIVGPSLCRDPDFINLGIQFAIDVASTSAILRLIPVFARPLVNFLISNIPKRIRHGVKRLRPVIQAHREALEGIDKADYEAPDLLTWLMMEASEEELSDWNLTSRILMVNFAAIHTTSITFTHALYYLAAFPEYLLPLRMEIEQTVKREGWSKDAVDQMHQVDSFIKESQRLHPVGSMVMQRTLVKNHTFSDGTALPRGTEIALSILHRHLSEDSFENPLVFDPFRFSRLKEQDTTGEKKLDLITTSLDSLSFGHGKRACPARYFAASELKLMVAHMVVTYDVKLEIEGVRPPDMWMANTCIPNPKTKVLFRKRKV